MKMENFSEDKNRVEFCSEQKTRDYYFGSYRKKSSRHGTTKLFTYLQNLIKVTMYVFTKCYNFYQENKQKVALVVSRQEINTNKMVMYVKIVKK